MQNIDIFWVILASGLVFLMQAGFLCLETGVIRGKNNINVVMKNLTDFAMTTVIFWVFGFAIMFGATSGGYFGTTQFLPDYGEAGGFGTTEEFFVFMLFQIMFCGTAVTILSGAVAERLRFGIYIAIVFVISGLIYPVFGHWAWNGLAGESTGWLEDLGFIDFAGSTVVHSVGGWSALAILLIIGARKGRFAEDGTPHSFPGTNIPLAALGVMLLWFGWIGFNGGSTLVMDSTVVPIVMNTMMAGSTGLLAALVIGYLQRGRTEVDMAFNGSLGGLVGITANCHAVTLPSAAIIGLVAGAVVIGVDYLLLRFKIDDAVGAIPVHLGAGIWGTLAAGIFATSDNLLADSRGEQILVQLAGIAAAGAWTFLVTYGVFKLVDSITPLRVTEEEEEMGLDMAEHGTIGEWIDAMGLLPTRGVEPSVSPAVGD